MKKIFAVLAVVAMSFALVACGVDEKTLEKKARYFIEEAAEAAMYGDYDRVYELADEEQEFLESLSEKELKKYQEICREIGEELVEDLYY